VVVRKRTVEDISAALLQPDVPQGPEAKPGDPQISAVHQFLVACGDICEDHCIVDLGAGGGMLAGCMDQIWQDPRKPPRYVAVDLPDALGKLSLPTRIHNNSEKVEFSAFLAGRAAELSDRIDLVVIRNVFHELDILLTAKLLATLNNSLRPGTMIYIQDVSTLPNAERASAGWDWERFKAFLGGVGFEPTGSVLTSRTGIEWFFASMETIPNPLDESTVAARCALERGKQKRGMHEKLRAVAQDYAREEASAEYIWLSLEVAALDQQIGSYELTLEAAAPPPQRVFVGNLDLPLRPSADPKNSIVGAVLNNPAGLVATVRNKDDIDIALLIRESRSTVWFAGYSLKLTFRLEENREAIRNAASRGVSLRFLVVDPASDAAVLRSRQPVYADPLDLMRDIAATIADYEDFTTALSADEGLPQSMELRATIAPLSCSFFFIDDLCFASFYSHHLTGTSAPCLVFARQTGGTLGYYELLREEFREAFERASPLNRRSNPDG
jgi:methyltransferase family protein